MIKAVNIKGYKFGNGVYKFFFSAGFAMMDTDTNEFLSMDGVRPYVLRTKKLVNSCIDGEWPKKMLRVKAV